MMAGESAPEKVEQLQVSLVISIKSCKASLHWEYQANPSIERIRRTPAALEGKTTRGSNTDKNQIKK